MNAAVGVYSTPIALLGVRQDFEVLHISGLPEELGLLHVAEWLSIRTQSFTDFPVPVSCIRGAEIRNDNSENIGVRFVEGTGLAGEFQPPRGIGHAMQHFMPDDIKVNGQRHESAAVPSRRCP